MTDIFFGIPKKHDRVVKLNWDDHLFYIRTQMGKQQVWVHIEKRTFEVLVKQFKLKRERNTDDPFFDSSELEDPQYDDILARDYRNDHDYFFKDEYAKYLERVK